MSVQGWRVVTFVVFVLLMTGCERQESLPQPAGEPLPSATAQGQPECIRPGARTWTNGEVVTIPEDARATCVFTIHPLDQTLDVESEEIAWVGGTLSRGSDGRYYGYTGFGEITVWNPDGSFRQIFGRRGDGPGEFGRGALNIFPLPSGGIAVFHGSQQRWTLLDSLYQTVRTVSYSALALGGVSSAGSVFINDRTFVTAARPRTAFFNVVSLGSQAVVDARSIRTFGDFSASESAADPSFRQRRIAYVGDGTFWAGPPLATGRGYEIQLWSSNGTLLRTIRRSAAWYPEGVDVRPGGPPGSVTTPGGVLSLSYLGEGMLLVALLTPNARWPAVEAWLRDSSPRGEVPVDMEQMAARDSIRSSGRDVYWEVIDASAGALLASTGPITVAQSGEMASGWFQGSTTGYRLVELPDGLSTFQMVTVSLGPGPN